MRALELTRDFLRREQGATAVEFGLVAGPFVLSLVATFAIGLNFYMQVSLDYATRSASRDLLTGAAQTGGFTASQFQNDVCKYLPSSTFTCANLFLKVTALTSPAYVSTLASPYQTPYYGYLNAGQTALTPPALNASANAFTVTNTVGGCWLLVVQVVYPAPWLLGFLTPSGSTTYNGAKVNLLNASATFQTEPYASPTC